MFTAGAVCGFGVIFVLFFVISSCIKKVGPLEYGLVKSSFSGYVSPQPFHGGLHVMMPWLTFLTFPATRITLEWSYGLNADGPPIRTRTGKDKNDPDSGGQPISISCAIQYELRPDLLHSIYMNLGTYWNAKQRFILLAGNMVSNTAQDFVPQDFWTERALISNKMLQKIDKVLMPQGAKAVSFEIMKIDFAQKFEDSITSVQVATQQKVVNEYSQQVQQVLQQINVLWSENGAQIALINGEAQKTATELVGNATKNAFILKQKAKANGYRELQQALGFTPPMMAEYIKIQSLIKQSATGKVVVNVPPPSVAGKTEL
jgi:regulator of protease activity HflC (stomatin/prohibitin superfamily)